MRIFLILFLLSFFSISQNRAFIFLDYSNITRLTAIEEQITSIMESNKDVVLYVSGKSTRKFFTKKTFSEIDFIADFLERSKPIAPKLRNMEEVKNINNYFSEKNFLNGLDDFSVDKKYKFYFIVSGQHLLRDHLSHSLNEKIIKPLLLSNKILKRNNKVIKNIDVIILYDQQDKKVENNTEEAYTKLHLKIKSKIRQNYEIKSF